VGKKDQQGGGLVTRTQERSVETGETVLDPGENHMGGTQGGGKHWRKRTKRPRRMGDQVDFLGLGGGKKKKRKKGNLGGGTHKKLKEAIRSEPRRKGTKPTKKNAVG